MADWFNRYGCVGNGAGGAHTGEYVTYRAQQTMFAIPLLITLGIMGLFGYWYFLDYARWNPFGGPAMAGTGVALARTVLAGEDLAIRWEYEIFRDCPREVELFLANGHSEMISRHHGSTTGQPPGSRDPIVSKVHIPSYYEPQDLVITSNAVFHCNPFRSWRHTMLVPVTVVPATH